MTCAAISTVLVTSASGGRSATSSRYTRPSSYTKKLTTELRPQGGGIIVFDSVSRMNRNAAEGIELYMTLYDKGTELVFLK